MNNYLFNKYYVIEKVGCYEKIIIVIKYGVVNRLWKG